MKPGVATWEEMGPFPGHVLVVVNSEPGNTDEVAALLERLHRVAAPFEVHVVAEPRWVEWLAAQGVGPDRVLVASDAAGVELEVNHYIESPAFVHWFASRAFRVVVGSLAHSLHNDEVKTIFEQRACLLLGQALFLAHTLPLPFLYVLDADEILHRLARDVKERSYEDATRKMIEELHQTWVARGRPPADDSAESTGAFSVVVNRLASGLADYDENGSTSLPSRVVSPASRDLVYHLRDLVQEYAEQWHGLTQEIERLSAVVEERNAAVTLRDKNNAEIAEERRQAVSQRDEIINRLRLELDRLTRGWRRLVNGRARV